jgi:hypothetical protein
VRGIITKTGTPDEANDTASSVCRSKNNPSIDRENTHKSIIVLEKRKILRSMINFSRLSTMDEKKNALAFLQKSGLGTLIERLVNDVCREQPANLDAFIVGDFQT